MFYGWYIVGAGGLLMSFNAWTLFYGFTAFVNPIVNTFGWSYAQVSLAMSLRGLEAGALNPLVGMAVDRWPPRAMLRMGIIILALGFFCLSQVTSLAMFYGAFLIIGLGGSLAPYMVTTTTLAKWFKRDLGKAMSTMSTGIGIGGAAIPLLVKLVDTFGWQDCLLFLSIGVAILGMPLSFVFRDRPEDYGLLPDGTPQGDSKGSGRAEKYDFSTGVKETLKTWAFWCIGIATLFQMAGSTAANIHAIPYLTSLGMERSSASIIAMLVPMTSLGVRIPIGWLFDAFSKKCVLAFCISQTSVGLFLLWLMDGDSSFWLKLLFGVTLGIGVASVSLTAAILRAYFGARKFGTIFGLASTFLTAGMLVGPPLAGWVYDTLGMYQPIWLIFSGIAMTGAILMLVTPRPPTNL